MAPGDIVRHADYPQWGRGYVIRAKKSSADVFFQWGGKRKLAANEPLEPSRAAGIEADFFALCASLLLLAAFGSSLSSTCKMSRKLMPPFPGAARRASTRRWKSR